MCGVEENAKEWEIEIKLEEKSFFRLKNDWKNKENIENQRRKKNEKS